MNWLFRWLGKRILHSNESYHEDRLSRVVSAKSAVSVNSLRSQGMNFTIHNVSGGYVVEYHSYDNRTDESVNNIHIITADQDLGEELSKILTIELLRK